MVDAATGRVLLLTTHTAGNRAQARVLSGAVRDRRIFVQARKRVTFGHSRTLLIRT